MLSKYNSALGGCSVDWSMVVDNTEGFSGADISHLAQTAMIIPVRELKDTRFWSITSGWYKLVKF
jgi:ATP-dependent 26S proteasome regulatory subunit